MSVRLDPPGEVRIRPSRLADRTALARLAQLEGAPPPAGDHLLAEEDGALRAALPLDGGPVLADPFHRTADIVAMLELRAAGLTPPRGAHAPGVPKPARRTLRRPFRPATAKA